MNIFKKWKRTKGDTENLVDTAGNVYGHVNKHKSEGWRAFTKTNDSDFVPVMDRATKKPKNFKDIDEAKLMVESLNKSD